MSHRWPRVLPDGIQVLYTAVTSTGVDVPIFSRQTGEHHLVVANANAGMFARPFTGDFDQRPSFLANYDVAADGPFLMIRGIAPSTTDTRIAVLLRWDVP